MHDCRCITADVSLLVTYLTSDQADGVLRMSDQPEQSFLERQKCAFILEKTYPIGDNLRGPINRELQAHWQAPALRRDPIAVLEGSNQDRMSLLEVGYTRLDMESIIAQSLDAKENDFLSFFGAY